MKVRHIKEDGIPEETVLLVLVTFVHPSTLVPFIHLQFSGVIVKFLGIVYEQIDRLLVITHAHEDENMLLATTQKSSI